MNLMHPHLFKKNRNQSCPKKMIKKHANTLDVPSKCHGVNINIFEVNFFFFLKKKRNKQTRSLISSKSCEMNNFLVIPELCAF